MTGVRAFRICVGVVAEVSLLFVTIAHAGLSALPKSHFEPLPDGRHMLVFLSYVPVDKDEGRIAKLPNGSVVDLRANFPASGCYDINSRVSLWTAPWDGSDYWSVSEDCRFLVRWNIFGDGTYRFWEGGRLSWGLKLYDRGVEIKTHNVADLVDFPSLMEYTTGDWHYLWLDWDCFDRIIYGDEFLVRTTTHEQYRIDLRTGEILEEFRMWRTLSRAAAVLMAFASMYLVAIFFRRPNRVANKAPRALTKSTATAVAPDAHVGGRRFLSFRLRTLFVVTTAIALIVGIGYRWSHVALLMGSFVVASLLTRRTTRLKRELRTSFDGPRHSVRFWSTAIATVFVWAWCYLLSVPPVRELLDWLRTPEDVQWAIYLTVYRPLVWVEYYDHFDLLDPLDWYARAWQY